MSSITVGRYEGVRSSRRHVQPESRPGVDLFAVNTEPQPAEKNLHDGRASRAVLAQFLAGIETEHRHIHDLVSVDDFGDDRTRLDGHRSNDIVDGQMRPAFAVRYRAGHAAPGEPVASELLDAPGNRQAICTPPEQA